MVHALEEARRILAEHGALVDARPDSRLAARVRAAAPRGPVIGTIGTQRETKRDDQVSDRAVREVLRRRLFLSRRRGRFWHAMPFETVAELQTYLADHLRFSRRISWRVPRARRDGLVYVERPIRFEVLLHT